MESKLTEDQKITTDWKLIEGGKRRIRAFIRYDDQCHNGHNTFAITGETEYQAGNRWKEDSGGCIHDEIEKHFPEYKHLIKWHLVSSDGPMHYPGNVTYHAGNRDCWGKLKGEVRQTEPRLSFDTIPFTFKLPGNFILWLKDLSREDLKSLVPIEVTGGTDNKYSKWSFQGFVVEWYKCPFDTEQEAKEWQSALRDHTFRITQVPVTWGEGKERDFNAARSCAVWPEATEEQLSSDNLKDLLLERLPGLLERFKADIEALGFTF